MYFTDYQQQVKPTLMQSLNPKARLLCALVCTLTVVINSSLSTALILCLIASLILLFNRPTWSHFIHTLGTINFFMLFIWLTLPLTMPGAVLNLNNPTFSQEGLLLSGLLTLKTNAAAIFLLGFCGRLSVVSFGAALQAFGLPQKLITLFILFCRHLSCLKAEYRTALYSLQLRMPQTIGLKILPLYSNMICSTLVRAADRAELVRLAMLCKPESLQYLQPSHWHWTWKESLTCATILCLCIGLIQMGKIALAWSSF